MAVAPNSDGIKAPENEIVKNKAKVKAKNEPEVGKEGVTESNMANGDAPTGDAHDSVLGKK